MRIFSYGEGRKIHHIRDLEQKQVEQLFDCREESADKKDSQKLSENKARDIPFGFEGNEEKASFPFIDRRRDGR